MKNLKQIFVKKMLAANSLSWLYVLYMCVNWDICFRLHQRQRCNKLYCLSRRLCLSRLSWPDSKLPVPCRQLLTVYLSYMYNLSSRFLLPIYRVSVFTFNIQDRLVMFRGPANLRLSKINFCEISFKIKSHQELILPFDVKVFQ